MGDLIVFFFELDFKAIKLGAIVAIALLIRHPGIPNALIVTLGALETQRLLLH